jgi:preprotein translocase subunit SecG
MYAFLIVIHVIASIFLIAVILLQAGRGGGLADSFGGTQMQSLFGTKSATILTRLTSICAIAFIITCLSLAIISSHRSRSLIEGVNIPVSSQAPDVSSSGTEEQGSVPLAPVTPPTPEVAPVTPEATETQGGTNETK